MIGVVDYGRGNLLSVVNALDYLGAECRLCPRPEDLADCERLILPGVGAFADAMDNLETRGLRAALDQEVMVKRKPIFGICLGMQIIARTGFEGGEHPGLGWLEAEVVRLTPSDPRLRVPQVGWNTATYRADSPLFAGLPPTPDFYFVHSFHMRCADPEMVEATVEYGGPVTVAVRRDNIFATQFHPEKSQEFGLTLLENFLAWRP